MTRGHTKGAILHIVNGGRVVDLVAQKRTRSSAPRFHHLLPRTSSDRWSHKSGLCASLQINRGQVTCATHTQCVVELDTKEYSAVTKELTTMETVLSTRAWLDKLTYRG